MTRTFKAASLAALGILLSLGTALAATGHARQAVNIRAGAGTGHAIIGHLAAGEAVEVLGCASGWLATDEGYVAQALLRIGGTSLDDDEDEDDEDEIAGFDREEGVFDDDPHDFDETVAESLWDDDFGDDD